MTILAIYGILYGIYMATLCPSRIAKKHGLVWQWQGLFFGGNMTQSNFTVLNAKGFDASLVDFSVFDFLSPDNKYFIFPGFCDVHVHFRQPGFLIKKLFCRALARRQEADIRLFVPCQIFCPFRIRPSIFQSS